MTLSTLRSDSPAASFSTLFMRGASDSLCGGNVEKTSGDRDGHRRTSAPAERLGRDILPRQELQTGFRQGESARSTGATAVSAWASALSALQLWVACLGSSEGSRWRPPSVQSWASVPRPRAPQSDSH